MSEQPDAIRRIIADQFGVAIADLRDEESFADLCADDLDVIEIIIQIEDALDVDIPDGSYEDDPAKITVGKFIAEIEAAILKATNE